MHRFEFFFLDNNIECTISLDTSFENMTFLLKKLTVNYTSITRLLISKLKEKQKSGNRSITSAVNCPVSFPTPILMPTLFDRSTIIYPLAPPVAAELSGSMALDGECTDALLNTSSDEYKDLARELTLEVKAKRSKIKNTEGLFYIELIIFWAIMSDFDLSSSMSSVADPGFSRRGAPTPESAITFHFFCR